jgi:sugar/nucleoside kinase (ribokinase family)
MCVIHEATGKRSIFFDGGTAGAPSPDEVDPALVRRAAVLLADGTAPAPAIRAAEIAREAGLPVVVDVEHRRAGCDELLRLSTHPILPLRFGTGFAGVETPLDICRAVQALGPATVVVTLGDQGCVAVEGDTVYRVPAFDVPVVDTTGAGDVFHGAFAYGLALGKGLGENLRFASAAAALSCRALGGRAGLATIDEVEALVAHGQARAVETA